MLSAPTFAEQRVEAHPPRPKTQTITRSAGLPVHDSCWGLNDDCEYYTSNGKFDSAYSIIRYYIVHCYGQANAERTFADLGGCAGGATPFKTVAGRLQYSNWMLDTVLKLRSDDAWFCNGVNMLTPAYNNYGSDIRAYLAIEKFLVDNPRCSSYASKFGYNYDFERNQQIHVWQDTAKNDSMKYFDSSLPSLHELGLDSLLSRASVHGYEAQGPKIIVSARLRENPFVSRTVLSVKTTREAYLHVEVLDLLGRKLEGAGFEGVFEPGEREVPIDLRHASPGTYYLRITTANNEVQTLKMVMRR